MQNVETDLPVQEAAPRQEVHNPEDIAAAFFKKEKNSLINLLKTLSAKQMRRTLMHVVSYPMIGPGEIHLSDVEKRCAYLINEMMFNKNVMQLAYEMQKVEAAQNKQEETKTGETNG